MIEFPPFFRFLDTGPLAYLTEMYIYTLYTQCIRRVSFAGPTRVSVVRVLVAKDVKMVSGGDGKEAKKCISTSLGILASTSCHGFAFFPVI